MNNSYQQRMMQITDALIAQGIDRYTAAPILYRLAWRLGLRVRPPLYQSFRTLVLSHAAWFGLGFGILMWFFFWLPGGYPLPVVLLGIVLAGIPFGLLMAASIRRKAKHLHLPPID